MKGCELLKGCEVCGAAPAARASPLPRPLACATVSAVKCSGRQGSSLGSQMSWREPEEGRAGSVWADTGCRGGLEGSAAAQGCCGESSCAEPGWSGCGRAPPRAVLAWSIPLSTPYSLWSCDATELWPEIWGVTGCDGIEV